jgi:DnaK suppressor protein
MDIAHFMQRLTELERTVADSTERAVAAGGREPDDSTHDSGDASMATETSAEKFAEAELSSATLVQIRGALLRLEAGTFGKCVVDGAPIEEHRLAAVPWTPHCLVHAKELEATTSDRMPTL